MKKQEAITVQSIQSFVDLFYERVAQEPLLSPVFEEVFKAKGETWETHNQRMVKFWSSILLRTKEYHGNPVQKHLPLRGFTESSIQKWLQLFATTSDDVFTPTLSLFLREKSQRMGLVFRKKLQEREGV